MHELAQLSEETRELAASRYRVLQPHLEQDRTLRSVANEAGVSFRTLQRWVAQYRRAGLVGLVRKGREDAGGRRKLSPTLQVVVEGLALERPRLPIVSIHRRISAFARWMGEEPPSYWVVRDLVQHLPELDYIGTPRSEGLQRSFRPGASARSARCERNLAG